MEMWENSHEHVNWNKIVIDWIIPQSGRSHMKSLKESGISINGACFLGKGAL